MHKQLNVLFISLTALVFSFLLIPNIFQEGLFMDGLIYSTTGLNLAKGTGTFWNLSFTKTIISNFDGHPPLAMYLQSIFFKLFGDSHSIEKFYSFITAVITAILMISTWNFFHQGKSTKQLSWLPVLLWITIPVCFWSYQNNVLENTMGVFTLAAVLISIYALNKDGLLKYILLLFPALFMVLGFLTKGFPAFFPLAVFGLHFIVYQKKSLAETFINTVFVFLVSAFILFLVFYDDSARAFITNYINVQVLSSLKGNLVVDPRTFVVVRLLRELMAPFFLMLLIFLIAFLVNRKENTVFTLIKKENVKDSLFLILIGLSASMPIMISPKQMGFYLLPAIPFFVLAFSVIIAPLIINTCSKKISSGFYYANYTFFLFALISISIYTKHNSVNPTRDKELLADVKTLSNYLEKGTTIGVSPPLFANWSLIGYLQRYYFINMEDANAQKYILTDKNSPLEKENYQLELETTGLLLYVNQD
ncbi:MAG: glycosyltransferase family 39 protein [Bacteroidota bacterium]|nr:glycosyltransferase family 39 protein [Bacteroidota bacterium]